jgi:hypothetical protein
MSVSARSAALRKDHQSLATASGRAAIHPSVKRDPAAAGCCTEEMLTTAPPPRACAWRETGALQVDRQRAITGLFGGVDHRAVGLDAGAVDQ